MNLFCRACHAGDLIDALDLGEQRISDFRRDDSLPPRFSLKLMLCRGCGLVQLSETTPRGLLYTNNYGFWSSVNESIVHDLRRVVEDALRLRRGAETWLDIGSNDGSLLSQVPTRIHRVGVDPVEKFASRARRWADEIVTGYFKPDLFSPDYFDIITSVSMFYDLDDPNEFVAGVKAILAPGGVWVVQQNHVMAMLQTGSFDNICHEHVTYWALGPMMDLLDRHGLQIVGVKSSSVNGGSMRTFIRHKGYFYPQPNVPGWLRQENLARVGEIDTYRRFALRVAQRTALLHKLVTEANEQGKTVYIYAASTRGSTIWQAAGLHCGNVVAAVERNPAKVGLRYSPIGVPIISEEQARSERPDYMLVGPWWFRDQIIDRESEYLMRGGRLVFPLPTFEIVEVAG